VKILLLNQTFYPDVVSTAQHLQDLALRLAEHGHSVTVVTSRRAYDDPRKRFAKTETWQGIKIQRLATTAFGKGARWRRAADFASFMGACCLRLALLPRPDAVVALTTPPLISFVGAVYARLRAAQFVYWVMDLNPDEAVAAGWLGEGSPLTRVLQWMSRFSFRHADRIIALDRFMQSRIEAKGIAPDKITVIPPWSHDDAVRFDPEGRETFRGSHGLSDKFVVMYSGNHSPCHPLDTLLAAAEKLAHRKDIVFCFVGGGSEWRKIKERMESRKPKGEMAESNGVKSETGDQKTEIPSGTSRPVSTFSPQFSALGTDSLKPQPARSSLLPNLLCLPYQPLSELSASLSAADIHVVVMGEAFVGIIHPCKIYNVLAVGAPILCIGPKASHLSEVLDALQAEGGGSVRHGDVDRCVSEIERVAAGKHRGKPERYAAVARRFSQHVLLPQLVAELERETPEGHMQPGNVIISKSKC